MNRPDRQKLVGQVSGSEIYRYIPDAIREAKQLRMREVDVVLDVVLLFDMNTFSSATYAFELNE